MRILAIETSCDETGLALIEARGGLKSPNFQIIKNLVSSQVKIHAPFGGVVPNLAKREHLKNLPVLFRKILPLTKNKKPDLIAVTVGPGLEPALWTGVNFAKEIRKNNFPKAKIFGANHLEGHLYSFLLNARKPGLKIFPAVAAVVSGGHTILVLMKSMREWKKIGETRDDAVGEAFDKVARMLDLPYPGGPELEKLATKGDPKSINFPRPMIGSKNYEFSFSGLKTSVLYYLRDLPTGGKADIRTKADVAASFQMAAVETITSKTNRAVKEFGAKSIMLSGGVAANKALRTELKSASRKLGVNFLVAGKKFNTDNAAIIAVGGYIGHLKGKKKPIRADANLNL